MKAIVTANFGDYDNYNPISVEGWDCFYYTDKDIEVKGWMVINLGEQKNPQLTSRHVKMLTHKYLPDYDTYCYIDANMFLHRTPPHSNIRVLHPNRTSIRQEAQKLSTRGMDCTEQVEMHYKEGLPEDHSLIACGYFIRDRSQDELHNIWFEEYLKGTHRDQITFPVALWKHKTPLEFTLWSWDRMEMEVSIKAHK